MSDLVEYRRGDLYCRAGDFYIDPMRPVPRAVITHAHADHARSGSGSYLCANTGQAVLRLRLGRHARIQQIPLAQRLRIGEVCVSFYPAGHIRGATQVLIEHRGRRTVVTGDFKREADPTCLPFEPVRCHTLVTESTFPLPVYRWSPTQDVIREVVAWREACYAEKRPAVIFCYALGKAQRLLAELNQHLDETVLIHGAVQPLTRCYRRLGVRMLPTEMVSDTHRGADMKQRLVMAPPSAAGSPWMKRFRGASTGFASGWMRIRGNRRRRGYDRGFVLSDHADWPGLLNTVADSGAERILCHHGRNDSLVRHLREQGLDAVSLER